MDMKEMGEVLEEELSGVYTERWEPRHFAVRRVPDYAVAAAWEWKGGFEVVDNPIPALVEAAEGA